MPGTIRRSRRRGVEVIPIPQVEWKGTMAKTIEQQQDELMATLPYLTKSRGGVKGFKDRLRIALREIARDQRHACAESVFQVAGNANNAWLIDKDVVCQAVMNAPEPGK